ncbi:MAG: hypothetical protein JW716_05760 [Candidatus Aenigmarchaeota archaeon]|nr:hypothetical protein [Candidatus Aenigmarchaeota archaeon]
MRELKKTSFAAFIISMVILSASASAFPEIADVVINPAILWLDSSNSVEVGFKCYECARAEVHIEGPGTNLDDVATKKAGLNNDFGYSYVAEKPGTYNVELKGFSINDTNTTNTTTVNFAAQKLKAVIISPSASHPILKYKDELFDSVYLDFSLLADEEMVITESQKNKVDFRMFLDNVEIDLQTGDDRYDTQIGHWKFTPKVPSTLAPNLYDLTIHAKYDGQTVVASHADSVIVKPSFEAEIIEPTTNKFLSLKGTDKMTVKVRLSYKGQPIQLGDPSFTFYLGDEKITTLVSQDDTDKYLWYLQMVVPGQRAGTKDITMYVSYNGETPYPPSLTEKDAVHFVIPFAGRILDSSGTVQHIDIKLEDVNQSKYYTIQNGNDGRYNADIIPGTYDMNVQLPGLTAVFNDVEITEENLKETASTDGPINFDAPKAITTIDGGIDVIKAIVLEFDLPFSNSELTMSYDDSRIRNEENLEVYQCFNWNFGKGACADEWEKVSYVNTNTRGNVIMFNTTQPSAFIIGERKELEVTLDSDIGYGTYITGENVIIKGQVTDSSGNAIEAADVEISIVGMEENYNNVVKTIISGNFKSQIEMPTDKGIYNLSVKASRYPFKEVIKYFTIETEIKEEISFINVPDGQKLYVGEPLDIKFSLLNSGQTVLKNIKLYVAGLATEWYQLLPVSINELEPGAIKDVELKLLVSKSYCDKYECKNYYPVTLQAKSDQIDEEALMTLTLRTEKEVTVETIAENKENVQSPFSLDGLITGGIASGSSAESIAVYGGIIIISVLVVLSLRKRYTTSGGIVPRDPKTVQPNVLHFMKSGMNKNTQQQNQSQFGGLLGQNRKKNE